MHTTAMTAATPARKLDTPAAWLMVVVVVDLLFMPRLLFAFGIPASLVIVIATLTRQRFDVRPAICLLVMLVAMVASLAAGHLTGDNPTPVESLKRVLQLATSLLYALYNIDLASVRPRLVKVLRVFYVYVFCAAVLFLIDPELYETLLQRVYPEAMSSLPENLLFVRFAYFFDDPNSAAYFIAMTLVVYVDLETDRRWAFVAALLGSLTVLATQSRGAYIALMMIFGHRLVIADTPRHVKLRVVVALAFLAAALASLYSDVIADAYTLFNARFEYEDDLGGGRVGKYTYFLQNLNLLPYGPGYHLVRDGVEFRPHSDLIRLNLAYGILAVPAFLYFVVPRQRSQILLFVVFLIPFLINTVIDDYRLLPTYLLLHSLMGQVRNVRSARARRATRRANGNRTRRVRPPLEALQ